MHGQIVKLQLEKQARVKIQASSSVLCEPRAKILNGSARTKCPVKFFSRELVRFLHYKLNWLNKVAKESLSNEDDDYSNENGKKNNNFARASRFFVHFSAVTARLRRRTS